MHKVLRTGRLVLCILVVLLGAALIFKSAEVGFFSSLGNWAPPAFFGASVLYIVFFIFSTPLAPDINAKKRAGNKLAKAITLTLMILVLIISALKIFKVGVFASFGDWLIIASQSLLILFVQVWHTGKTNKKLDTKDNE
jgi:hypothetical protein